MVTNAFNNHRFVSQVEKDKPRHEPTYNPNKVVGIVTAVELYVRTAASADAEPIMIAKKNDILVVDKAKSTEDFYKVSAENGLGGFAAKEYVTLKEENASTGEGDGGNGGNGGI